MAALSSCEEKEGYLSLRVLISLAHHLTHTHISRAPGNGNVARQSTSLMSKNVCGYSLNKHVIYDWAVVILIFEILPFSFRYDSLELLFAKIYVCINELVLIRTLCDGYYKNLASPKDSILHQLISKHL